MVDWRSEQREGDSLTTSSEPEATADRWRRVETLYHEILAVPADERRAALAASCPEDPDLAAEIESLLAQPASAEAFLKSRALAAAAELVSTDRSSLSGHTLGAFEIRGLLGVGGMGEVYRAQDTKLGREVAVKVLPPGFASDPDRVARFRREARLLASLNHPNIAAIHGLDEAESRTFLVLELVEGQDLAERLRHGALPLDQAIAIARQIAEGLEEAHDQGIVHRDLKPANIKVTPEGKVKILDFGLAKVIGPSGGPSANPDDSGAPTQGKLSTGVGTILGTAAYMSPEQARGKPVDRRADIWAFGAVLFEMLTGERAFRGDSAADTLAAVVGSEPAWDALPRNVSPTLAVFLRRCLQKDSKQRVSDIRDMRLALEGAFETGPQPAAPDVVVKARWRRVLMSAAPAAVTAVLFGAGVWILWPAAAPLPVTRTTIAQSSAQPLAIASECTDLALSPDGTQVVYRVNVDGRFPLVIHRLDALEGTVLYDGSACVPFFSPDGAWVGFFDATDGKMKRVAVTGGPPLTIATIGSLAMAGVTWAEDGTIIFGTPADSGLWKVPAGGGAPQPLTTLDASRREHNHEWPELLPGGRALLFTISREGEKPGAGEIVMRDLRTGEQRVLVSGGAYPKYVPTGHLIYAFAGTLMAVPFDPGRKTVTGNPVRVVEGLVTKGRGGADMAVARDGSLVYVAGAASMARRRLVWVNREGREEAIPAPVRSYLIPRLSPDGTEIALDIRDQENDIWVWSLTSGTLRRLTFDPGTDRAPAWTPDGRRIAFSSEREGQTEVFWRAADGTGPVERLAASANDQFQYASSFSPDGTRLALLDVRREVNRVSSRLTLLGLLGERRTTPLVPGSFDVGNGEISPDGRWLAYQANEYGRFEIYVRPFPGVESGRWQVSTGGGETPVWSRSGKELFFRGLDDAVLSVAVEDGSTFRTGPPRRLVRGGYFGGSVAGRTYDVSRDGKRFLMITEGASNESDAPPRLVLVRNWIEELKRLAPTKP